MNVSFDIPRDVAQELSATGPDVTREAKEAYLVDLYRRERISHRQLADALGLCRYDTDGVLKRHKVWLELTSDELAAQVASLHNVRPE